MAKNRNSGKYSLEGLPGYTITVSNVPNNITPRLIPISAEEEARLRDLNKDGNIKLITSVAGNLVFEDENGILVNHFSSPIRLTYNFTPEDEEKRKYREHKLQTSGDLAENENVSLIPIFLYQYDPQKTGQPEFEVWQPFQNFSFNEQDQTVSIDFLFWGDRQIGGGTQP